jgi:hypothetical protein
LSLGFLFIGCFNTTAAQDRRVNAGKFLTQMVFLVPALAALAVAFLTHLILGCMILAAAAYLWRELTLANSGVDSRFCCFS